MSRAYQIQVEVRRANLNRLAAINERCAAERFVDELTVDDGDNNSVMIGNAIGNLFAGETEEEFANELTRAIWKANGAFCDVTVRLLHLDDLPFNVIELGEDDYAEWIKSAA